MDNKHINTDRYNVPIRRTTPRNLYLVHHRIADLQTSREIISKYIKYGSAQEPITVYQFSQMLIDKIKWLLDKCHFRFGK